MIILKKVIRKLYHLIWFLGAFLLFSPCVNAVGGTSETNGVEFVTAPYARMYDNTNENLTEITVNYNSTGKYYYGDLYYNGADTAGGNINFTSLTPIQSGYTYALSILVGSPVSFKVSTKRVCIAENAANAVTRWHNNWCVTPSYTDSTGTSQFHIANSSYPNTIGYSILYYIFTSNVSGRSINIAFNSNDGAYSTTTVFGGYKLELLSDNSSLTQSQIQSAVQNSGLATANSVAQVQQGINEVKQELSGVQQQQQQTNEKLDSIDDTLNDSNVDSSDSTINNLKDKIPTNSVISDLLLLPVRFLQNFVNALGSSCSRFSLGSLYGTELFMPCINIESYLGSGIWTTIDLIISGLFVYSLRKKFIEIYENLTNLKNGGNEVD